MKTKVAGVRRLQNQAECAGSGMWLARGGPSFAEDWHSQLRRMRKCLCARNLTAPEGSGLWHRHNKTRGLEQHGVHEIHTDGRANYECIATCTFPSLVPLLLLPGAT